MIDFSSWQSVLSALAGIALFALVGIGIRLMVMMRYQQRRERQNRQINERLKVLIAAYKVLGGSFTGSLIVDPTHLKDLRALLQHVGDHAKAFTTEYGNVSTASVGAIQRALLTLDQQGGDRFFGEPALDIADMIGVDDRGRGLVNILAAAE